MRTTRHAIIIALTVIAALPFAASAQTTPTGTAAASAPSTELSEGEVRRIDRAANKLTLKHGPIAHLDMPAMTMVFQASDPKLLDGLKVGDRVRFAATHEAGQYGVSRIEPVDPTTRP